MKVKELMKELEVCDPEANIFCEFGYDIKRLVNIEETMAESAYLIFKTADNNPLKVSLKSES